ncbi:AAA family ATPase [Sorangium sp. So ce764]|uniref:AAA family ATPase n=1 Tax=Sorangium sp. So ce764 TaxID=3133320 RepID=UPI003F63D385
MLKQEEMTTQNRAPDLPHLLPLEDLERRLTGLRRFLLPDGLPFVAPAPESGTDPDRLLTQSLSAAKAAVLLLGPAGIGKTRTLLEVARRANVRGVAARFVLPGLPDDALAEAVLGHNDDMLLVFDDLERLTNDLPALVPWLASLSARRGKQIAFIASARAPDAVETGAGIIPPIFEIVTLDRGDEQEQLLIASMPANVAPRTTAQIGETAVRRLGGERPAVALAVLSALEQRAIAGTLAKHEPSSALPSGDLRPILRDQLAEADLAPGSLAALDDGAITPGVVAAAAVLASAPLDEDALIEIAREVIAAWPGARMSSPQIGLVGRRVVHALQQLGWLTAEQDQEPEPALDVLAEELLIQVLRTSEGALRETILTSVLAPAKRSPRSLRGLSRALRHLIRSQTGSFEVDLIRATERWLAATAPTVGAMLRIVEPEQSEDVLANLFTHPLWEQSALACWDRLALPWLSLYATRPLALVPLVKRLEQVEELDKELLDLTRLWLEDNGWLDEAAWILRGILSREELDAETAESFVQAALNWLHEHDTSYTHLVLAILLARNDLRPESAARAATAALTWLDRHHAADDAGIVVAALIGRSDLDTTSAKRATNIALNWLDGRSAAMEAGEILSALLLRSYLSAENAVRAVDAAFTWLSEQSDTAQALLVLYALLQRANVDPERRQRAVELAFIALERHGSADEAHFLLRWLLSRENLDPARRDRTIETALSWLVNRTVQPSCRPLLEALLKHRDLSPHAVERAVEAALSALSHQEEERSTSRLLRALLERPHLPPARAARAIELAFSWLSRHGGTSPADHTLLGLLLKRPDLAPGDAARAVTLALRVLTSQRSSDAAWRTILAPLLARHDLDAQSASLVIQNGLLWTRRYFQRFDAWQVLAPLLARRDFDATSAAEAVDLSLSWLERHGDRPTAWRVLALLTIRSDLDAEKRATSFTRAVAWLSRHGQSLNAHRLLFPLLVLRSQNTTMSPENAEVIVRRALAWLSAFVEERRAVMVVYPLLLLDDLTAADEAQAREAALRWLAKHGAMQDELASTVQSGRALPDKAALLKALEEASERQPDQLHLDRIIPPQDVPAASEMLLLQFVVENFLSFRDKAVLSLLAVDGVPHDESHVAHLNGGQQVLKCAAIYGANASGKSNLVKALQFAQRLVVTGTKSGEPTGVTPFKLGEQADAPTRFEFELGMPGRRYAYGFVATPQAILSEWLFEDDGTQERRVFERSHDESRPGRPRIELGDALLNDPGRRQFLGFVAEGTRNNQLFLTEASERNVVELAHITRWFRTGIHVVLPDSTFADLAARVAQEPSFKAFIEGFLSGADTGITSLDVEPVASSTGSVEHRIRLVHPGSAGRQVAFSLEEESDGTRRLLHIAPFVYEIGQQRGAATRVYAIDELDRSLHPLLTRAFIQSFLSVAPTEGIGQLIFTTHDTNLLDVSLLSRDSIWFVEKDAAGASSLYALSEFKGAQLEQLAGHLEQGYLQGRFGAIPFFGEPRKLGWMKVEPG